MARAFDRSRAPRGARARCAVHPVAAGFRPASAALAVAFAFGLAPSPAGAQPVLLQVTHGTASVQRSGANMTVTTGNGANSNYSAIDWRSFSVPAGSITNFIQPSATSTSINRVVEANPTQILGRLQSNGRLVLVNPWGIAVGAGAQVDTAGFTASTLALSDADAIAGRSRFAGGGSLLQVDGVIKAKGGDVVLIAPQVQTGAKAVIESDGAAILAAGQKVEITGRGLEGIRMEVQAGNAAVNLGSLKGDAVGMFANTLRHSGLVQAQALSTEGGKVVLKATGDALVDGTVRAVAGQRGGTIAVLGQRVGLLAGAAVDASGATGGGQVRIGGDAHGANAAVPNARRTYVDARASVRADATQRGDGGRIVVWADEVTRMHGQLSARGGARGGNGGFAEVSGKQSLEFTGRVDLRAPQGKAGTLLLDPNDIVITGSQPTDTTTTGSVFEGGGDVAHVAAADLNAQLALGDVIVSTSGGFSSTATGQLTVASDASVNWHSGTTLTLAADNGIALQGQVAATSSADGSANGALHLVTTKGSIVQAAGSTVTAGQLLAQAPQGNVQMDQANHVGTVAGVSGDTGSFSFHDAQDLVIGTVSVGTGSGAGINFFTGKLGATSVSADGGLQVRQSVAGGSVTLTAAGALDVQGPVSVEARKGQATLDAGADLRVATETGFYTTTLSGSDGLALKAGGAVRASGFFINTVGAVDGVALAQLSGGGGAGKGVTVTAAGDIDFGPVSNIDATQSPVTVSSSGGSILGEVNVTTGGSVAGAIKLDARGDVSFGTLLADGSAAAPQAGAVTVTAGASVHGATITSVGAAHGTTGNAGGGTVSVTATDGNITLGSVLASGGDAQDTGTAGVSAGGGGAITLSALGVSAGSGNVTVGGGLVADGGAGGFMSGLPAVAGGTGGSVTVLASRDITLGQGEGVTSISASGGAGGSATAGTAGGGAGGTVSLSSAGGSIVSAGTVQVLANGGDGPDPTNPLVRKGGGTIDIRALAGSITLDSLQALDSSSGSSAQAGDGGTITVTAGQDLTLTNTGFTVLADGGFTSGRAGGGGSVSLLSTGGKLTVAGDIRAIGGAGGQGGDGGQVSARAAGNLDVQGIAASSGGSTAADSTAPLAGSVTLTADAGDLHARFATVRGGAANAGVAGNGGSLTLTALGTPTGGGRITIDNGLDADGGGGLSSLGSNAQGGKGGTIVVNAGRDILVGQRDGAGTVTVSGNLNASGGDSFTTATGGAGGTIQLDAVAGSVDNTGQSVAKGGSGASAGGAGGTVTVSAGTNVSLGTTFTVGGNDRSANGRDGVGGAVTVSAVNGDVTLGTVDTLGHSGGKVHVTAGGNQFINLIDASATGAVDGAGGNGGSITLEALSTRTGAGSIQAIALLSVGGASNADAGSGGAVTVSAARDINVQDIAAYSGFGAASSPGVAAPAGGAVLVDSLAGNVVLGSVVNSGAQGGDVTVRAHQGQLQVANITSTGSFSSAGVAGGKVLLEALGTGAAGGTIELTGGVDAGGGFASRGAAAAGGTVTMRADKGITVAGGISVDGGTAGISGSSDTGGQAGTVDLSSANGNITTAGISASGGFSASLGAGGGGIIRLSALGTGSTAGTISDTISFTAEGGGTSTGTGGRGGQVSVAASKDVRVQGMFAHGGDSGAGASGGVGGSVTARFGGTLAAGFLTAQGGTGGEGTTASPNGGAGGSGGTIDLGYTGSGTFVLDGTTMLAMGGQGGAALPASAGLGGAGGSGGTIIVAAPAGSLSLQLNADGVSRSTLLATAGFGGVGGDGTSVGASGAAGQVNARAGANLGIAAANLSGSASIVATAGGTLDLGQDLVTIGNSVTLQAGGDLNVRAAIDTTEGGLAPAGAVVKLQAGGNVLLDVPPPVVVGTTSPATTTTTTSPATTATTSPATTAITSPATAAAALAAAIGGGSVAGTGTTISGSSVTVGSSTSIVATGGDVVITADHLDLQGTIAAGTARTVLRPLTDTRAMRLGGVDDGSTLHLSQAEVGRIAAGTLLVGDGANTGGLTVGGPITVDPALVTSLSLVTRGPITQAAAAPLAAQALNADGGSVNLDQVTVSTLSGRGQSGAFTVANQGSGPLAIGTVDGITGVVASGPMQVTTPGALALDAGLTSSASGNAITLDAASLVVGSGATLATPAGRWLVYLAGPEGNNFGTLASNNFALWGRSFSANPPATVTEAGNRYLFALRPTLDVTANAVSKVYDGSAGFGTLGFTATGFVDAAAHQNAFLQDGLAQLAGAPAIASPGKNAGSYAITQGTLASSYAIRFAGNTATITPAPLTIAADNLGKTEGTALNFTGTEFTAGGLVAGEQVSTVTLTSAGAPASAPAGAYAITASNAVGTNGFQAGNYDIHFLDGALAVAAAPVPQPQASAQAAPVQQVNNQVVTFASLFVEEARIQPAIQARLDDGKKRLGQDDIVVTDNACKR